MLKKISTRQLRIGMHVHQVCGSWLEHPFWRKSFHVSNTQQIRQLASVGEVIIDTAKGVDVEAPVVGTEALAHVDDVELDNAVEASDEEMQALADAVSASGPAASLQVELARASAIVASARGAMASMFNDVRMGKAVDTDHCLPLVQDITESVARHPGALVSLARLKTSDDYTYMHSVAVCALMVALARQLGLPDDVTREAGLAGLVHDIGKAMMPLDVLNKPGALTAEEFAIMKRHPEAGHQMLLEGKGVGPGPLDVALHHHEKVNGRGYPHGLKGDEISLLARMGAVCDVYDAITSNRPYKAGWDPAEAIRKMAAWTQEGHFDERLFQAFVKSVGIYPTGSLVRLRSERLAVVVDQGQGSLLQPLVRVVGSARTREPQQGPLINLADSAAVHDAIVGRESPSDWADLGPLDAAWMQAS